MTDVVIDRQTLIDALVGFSLVINKMRALSMHLELKRDPAQEALLAELKVAVELADPAVQRASTAIRTAREVPSLQRTH